MNFVNHYKYSGFGRKVKGKSHETPVNVNKTGFLLIT